jgi:hypothetical protein
MDRGMTSAQEGANPGENTRDFRMDLAGRARPALAFLATGARLFPSSGRDDVELPWFNAPPLRASWAYLSQ